MSDSGDISLSCITDNMFIFTRQRVSHASVLSRYPEALR